MSDHIKNMEEASRRRREARQARRDTQRAGGEQPAPGAELEPAKPGGVPAIPPAHTRPQPFTPDLIPEPVPVPATGDLTADELEDLRQCERAFAHADEAEWMRGKAAHAVRDRRLYRPRTWPEYCDEVLGESESEVNRMILEWPIGAMIAAIWPHPRPVPASHRRALLPLVDVYGLEPTARGYVRLRLWAIENKERLTAATLTAMVDQQRSIATGTDDPLPVAQFLARKKLKALEGGQSRIPMQPSAPPRQETTVPQPVATAAAEPSGTPPAGHPNLGEPGRGADAEEEIVDAEIVVEGRGAGDVRAALQEVRDGIEGALRGAAPGVLKAVAVLGDEIAAAAREELNRS